MEFMEENSQKNQKKFNFCRVLAYFCLSLTLLLGSSGSFAEDFEEAGLDVDTSTNVDLSSELGLEQDQGEQNPEVTESSTNSPSEQEKFLNRLKNELDISKSEYYQITKNIRETRNRIDFLKDDLSELQTQIMYFDDQISQTTEKLFTVIRQVVRTENEIKILYEEIDIKQVALVYQKELLKDYIRELYVYGDTYLEVDSDGEIDAFKLLLADGNTGDVLKEIKYLGILEETGDLLVGKLDELTQDLYDAQETLEKKKDSLESLQKELQAKKDHLSSQRAAKENLITLTRNQDEIYRSLLQQSLEEQQEALAEIQAFKETLAFIEEKIAEDGDAFDISEYSNLLDKKFMTIYEFKNTPSEGVEFIWPVLPERGISAYFHDSSYESYFGMQHQAIDVRAWQGTPIFAAADGVVYAAKDNDYGYSYIMIAHHDDFMTTYGHISNIMIEEGEVVGVGDIIGLSGGMPGTKGAGYMTTGPHLHFEIMKDGAYVDPLRFLPMEVLTLENIEELPDEYLDDWQKAIMRSELVKVSR